MDYNKIIIALLIILIAVVAAGFVLLIQSTNNPSDNVNNTTNNATSNITNNTTANNTVEHTSTGEKDSNNGASTNDAQSSKPPRTEYTGNPDDMDAYTEWRKQDLQSENPHRGYSVLDGPEKSPVQ